MRDSNQLALFPSHQIIFGSVLPEIICLSQFLSFYFLFFFSFPYRNLSFLVFLLLSFSVLPSLKTLLKHPKPIYLQSKLPLSPIFPCPSFVHRPINPCSTFFLILSHSYIYLLLPRRLCPALVSHNVNPFLTPSLL